MVNSQSGILYTCQDKGTRELRSLLKVTKETRQLNAIRYIRFSSETGKKTLVEKLVKSKSSLWFSYYYFTNVNPFICFIVRWLWKTLLLGEAE